MIGSTSKEKVSLSWWTWVIPFLVLCAGSHISALFKYAPGAAFYYLPTSIGVILINWWGPKRVVPAVFINACLNASLWEVGDWRLYPLYSLPETIYVFLSWLLFTHFGKGNPCIRNTNTLVRFLVLAIIIPLGIDMILLRSIYVLVGIDTMSNVLFTTVRSWLGEFISNFGLTLPVLYFFTPLLSKNFSINPQRKTVDLESHSIVEKIEFLFCVLILVVMSFTIEFKDYWFVYGLVSLYIAIRLGFGLAVFANLIIFALTYLLPILILRLGGNGQVDLGTDAIKIYLGTSLLFVFSAITGRTISDLRLAQFYIKSQIQKLEETNNDLELANKELDRFAYSVSHDLSAPLKSIQGLINVSRLPNNQTASEFYFGKIELCVRNLEKFIGNILDYSRTKRTDIQVEKIDLTQLCNELIEGLRYVDDGRETIRFSLNEIAVNEVVTDKASIAIILNNLLSNAIKFRRHAPNVSHEVRISSGKTSSGVEIAIEDNGVGISDEIKEKIFDMFFRGTEHSRGSGLGLYIAREAAKKIGAELCFESTTGAGTRFAFEVKS